MKTSKLKTYAPEARRDFIQAVTEKAAIYGFTAENIEPMTVEGDVALIGGQPFPKAVGAKRKKLEARIKKQGFDQTMEAMADTWFNRLVAIRYMELHEYLDHGYRVLSHPDGHNLPEIVEHAEHVDLPGLDSQKVVDLKLDGTKEEELYRMLLIAQCNALHKAMPFLFESIDDDTELLLPDNLLHSDSLIRNLVNEIDEDDWQEVEIIGWLYQFYISDKKDEVIGKVVKSEDIPAATQLFTPNWIVKYLVQNSLGRQWTATYPNSPLKGQMDFYIEPAEQTAEVQAKLNDFTPGSLNPEELTLLDPACGSGHILVEAYDLLKAIYQERGYRAKDIPRLILAKNLYGLEIDDRAAQLAAFALLMKCRADDRSIFERDVQPHVLSIQESKGLDAEEITAALNQPLADESTGDISQADVAHLIELFEHGKTFGSLLHVPESLVVNLAAITQRVEEVIAHGGMFEQGTARSIMPMLQQAGRLAVKYDAVVTNPPYLGMRAMNSAIRSFAQEHYPSFKLDTYSLFIARSLTLVEQTGIAALITMHSWMFLHRFESMRQTLLRDHTLFTVAHLGARAFSSLSGEVVQTCAFAISPLSNSNYVPSFVRCVDGEENDKRIALAENRNSYHSFTQKNFLAIEGGLLAYWVSDQVMRLFHEYPRAGTFASPRHGMVTSDNDRFLRNWWEVVHDRLGIGFPSRTQAASSGKKWFPYNKGGPYRKWFGNIDLVINWENDGEDVIGYARELYGSPSRKIQAQEFYFRSGITWSALSGGNVSMRANGPGLLFDSKGSSMFCEDEDTKYALMGVFNSVVATHLLNVMAPTLDYSAGAMANMPVPAEFIKVNKKSLGTLARECTSLGQEDWNSTETSLGFQRSPLVSTNCNVPGTSFVKWEKVCAGRWEKQTVAEEELNKLLIDAYELQGELVPDVAEEHITLYRPDREEDTKRLISYAIGCMMGRYSLDDPGLTYAHCGNEGFDPSRYKTFPADDDGIIPLTEFSWFEDDAAHRFERFIGTAWSIEHLQDNLTFVAESVGLKKGETPRDTIRRYLASGFYKHHLSRYKKRPIYWLFSSGKQRAFQALVYLHRYNEGTLARMRTEYIIPLLGKMTARIDQLADDIAGATSTPHQKRMEKEKATVTKQLAELQSFDEKLRHYADQRIALDLDDGVKVNYGKFGDLLAEVKAITGKKPEELHA